jgi:hypothetical protein
MDMTYKYNSMQTLVHRDCHQLPKPHMGAPCSFRYVSGKLIGSLGFSRRGVFIGEGAAPEVGQGALTTRGRGPGAGRAALWCGRPVAPLRLLFELLEASLNNRRFGFCFVQF